jgi:hypothetical protein
MAPHCFRYSQFVLMERERKQLVEEVQRLTALIEVERANTQQREEAQAEEADRLYLRARKLEDEQEAGCLYCGNRPLSASEAVMQD